MAPPDEREAIDADETVTLVNTRLDPEVTDATEPGATSEDVLEMRALRIVSDEEGKLRSKSEPPEEPIMSMPSQTIEVESPTEKRTPDWAQSTVTEPGPSRGAKMTDLESMSLFCGA